ncbi:unnamed protein product [Ectocarpus fasciculatus]
MTTVGRSGCLDAFIVALNQTCDGRATCWYASTLELQLVSLEFCGACRSILSFDVRIHEQTPLSMWSLHKPKPTPNKHCRRVCISSRVPAVQAIGWNWALPIEILLPRSAIELHPGSEQYRRPTGTSSATSLGRVGWFQKLRQIVVSSETVVNSVSWAASLQQLSFGDDFDQSIVGAVWPVSLQLLSFGREFNQAIVGAVWPPSLLRLSFGREFNQPIVGVEWPVSLQQLSFGFQFNQPIVGVVWRASLQKLSFGCKFNQPITGAAWPASLQQLSFEGLFNQPIVDVVWPTSLKQLSFGDDYFNQPIVAGELEFVIFLSIVSLRDTTHRRRGAGAL